ncbi:hypothetical protein ACFYNY_09640 [Streptomyces sp. NPDC006530]|uniref:hypothetical protein n=1 Tax=Streptomyces sp. NPDC006530 TaxID=3364750 RepID=UPI00367BC81D
MALGLGLALTGFSSHGSHGKSHSSGGGCSNSHKSNGSSDSSSSSSSGGSSSSSATSDSGSSGSGTSSGSTSGSGYTSGYTSGYNGNRYNNTTGTSTTGTTGGSGAVPSVTATVTVCVSPSDKQDVSSVRVSTGSGRGSHRYLVRVTFYDALGKTVDEGSAPVTMGPSATQTVKVPMSHPSLVTQVNHCEAQASAN